MEQAKLREEYIEGYRRSVRHHIEGIKIVDEEGNDVTPEKLRQVQREKVCMAVVSMILIHNQKSAGIDSALCYIFKFRIFWTRLTNFLKTWYSRLYENLSILSENVQRMGVIICQKNIILVKKPKMDGSWSPKSTCSADRCCRNHRDRTLSWSRSFPFFDRALYYFSLYADWRLHVLDDAGNPDIWT